MAWLAFLLSKFRGWNPDHINISKDYAFQIYHIRETIKKNSGLDLFLCLIFNAAATLSVCHYDILMGS